MKFFTPSSIFFTLKNGFPENISNKLVAWLNTLSSIISVNTKESETFVADEMIVFSRSWHGSAIWVNRSVITTNFQREGSSVEA